MKIIVNVLICLLAVSAVIAQSEFRIDFGIAAGDPGGNWNTASSPSSSLSSLTEYYTGIPVAGVDLTLTGWTNAMSHAWGAGDKGWVHSNAASDLIQTTSVCNIHISGLTRDEYTVKLLSSKKVSYQIEISISGTYGSGSENGSDISDNWDPYFDGWADKQWIEWQNVAPVGNAIRIDFAPLVGGHYACVNALCIYNDNSLPVELSQFSAEPASDGILLKWTTESETDNTGFILERQTAVSNGWQTITSYQTYDALRGQGNTSSQTEYKFKDLNVESGMTYQYRLSDVDFEGNITINDILTITLNNDTPDETLLQPAVPNPFNPQTKISYQLAKQSAVTLNVYDMNGRIVSRMLHNVHQTPGSYSIHWLGEDHQGRQAASGMYILRLIAGDVVKSQKVLLMR